MRKMDALINKYRGVPGGLMPALQEAQKNYGFLSEEVLIDLARGLGLPVKEVYGTASFYSMFSLKPRGRNVIRVCRSAPCHVAGAGEVVAALERELNIKMGESTPDGLFALETTECVGNCQATPVITVNGVPYEGVTPSRVSEILAEYC